MVTTKTFLSRILLLIYLAAVAFLCFSTGNSLPDMSKPFFLNIGMDKVAHFLMFLPFPILGYLSFDHPTGKPWKSLLFIFVMFIFGAAIAGATELVQGLLPYRTMDIQDFYADATALGISSLLVLIIDLSRKSR